MAVLSVTSAFTVPVTDEREHDAGKGAYQLKDVASKRAATGKTAVTPRIVTERANANNYEFVTVSTSLC